MTTSFINRIILTAVLTFSFAANGMAKEPSLMDYNGIEYFTWNIDDNCTLHITPLADVTPDFQAREAQAFALRSVLSKVPLTRPANQYSSSLLVST